MKFIRKSNRASFWVSWVFTEHNVGYTKSNRALRWVTVERSFGQ